LQHSTLRNVCFRFAFVEFSSAEEAKAAIENESGYELGGQSLVVDFSGNKSQNQRGGRGGRGGFEQRGGGFGGGASREQGGKLISLPLFRFGFSVHTLLL
jgi:RNA recognition motif-containing protein